MLIKITRTYGGQEGRRVKAGTVFFCGLAGENPEFDKLGKTLTLHRGHDLINARLAERIDTVSTEAAPGADPNPRRASPPERRTQAIPENRRSSKTDGPVKRRTPAKKELSAQEEAGELVKKPVRRRKPHPKAQAPEPVAPEQVQGPNGSQTSGQSGSSSQADVPSDGSTGNKSGRRRGTRKGKTAESSDGSPSTPASKNQSPSTSATEPTPDGGDTTETKSAPEEFLE